MKKNSKRLSLNKETLRTLDETDMGNAGGGAYYFYCSQDWSGCGAALQNYDKLLSAGGDKICYPVGQYDLKGWYY